MNTGVLNRHETIYTKSVQMHHVDAPGQLSVTVGSKQSIGENEDIKQLRQGLEKTNQGLEEMTNRQNKIEPIVGVLHDYVDQLNSELVNATLEDIQLTKRIVEVEVGLKPLISAAAAAQAHQAAVQRCKSDCDSNACIDMGLGKFCKKGEDINRCKIDCEN